MRKHVKQFVMRGLMAAAGGPIILAIVWLCIAASGNLTTLTVKEVAMGIITTSIMAFVAAGISIVYQIEALPKAAAGLIQGAVLYCDYLGFYLLNGWLPLNSIWIFSLIFVGTFIAIWLCIYIPIKISANKINRQLK